jgi:hypothetical protein
MGVAIRRDAMGYAPGPRTTATHTGQTHLNPESARPVAPLFRKLLRGSPEERFSENLQALGFRKNTRVLAMLQRLP